MLSEELSIKVGLVLDFVSAAATLLTMIGIYGAISYWVVQRRHELGIRRALGAPTLNILWLVMGSGLGLTAAGIVIGATGAVALTRLLQALLFRISPTDPATLAGVALLIAALTALAWVLRRLRCIRTIHIISCGEDGLK